MLFDDESGHKKPAQAPRVLDDMSVSELRDYIVQLRDEIARVEADIAKKENRRAAAEAFFKS